MNLSDITISDLSFSCLFIMVGYSLFTIKKSNLWSVLIFAIAALAFWFPLGWIPYESLTLYFFAAAVIDLTVLEILSLSLFKVTKFTTRLKGICLAFITLDLTSWLAFRFTEFNYITDIYNYICFILYASVLIIVTKEKENVRNNAAYNDNRNRGYIPVDYSQSIITVHPSKEEG